MKINKIYVIYDHKKYGFSKFSIENGFKNSFFYNPKPTLFFI